MTLIELLNEYDGEGLTATEQAVYFNLCLIWNKLRRPDWFAVSRAELMRKAGIKDHKTVDKARQSLEFHGYIVTQITGTRKPRKYRIKPKQAKGNNPLATKGNNPLANEPLGESIPQHKGNKSPRLGELIPPSQSTEYLQSTYSHSTKKDTTTNLYNTAAVKIQSSNLNSIGVQGQDSAAALPSVPQKVMEAFNNEIHPVCSPYELERLADDVDRFGEQLVHEAIIRASRRNIRNIGYVEGILKRWQATGVDSEEGGNHNHDNVAGNSGQGESADEWADRLAREYNLGG